MRSNRVGPRRRAGKKRRGARSRAGGTTHESEAQRESEVGPGAMLCLLCGRTYRVIAWAHLRRRHGFEGEHPIEDYKERFGLSVAYCHETRELLGTQRIERAKRNGQHWSREQVISELRRRHRAGLPLAASRLPASFYYAACRRFDSFERALESAGLDPLARWVRPPLDRERLLDLVRRWGAANEQMSAKRVEQNHPEAYHAGEHIFGNWGLTLRAAGLDASSSRESRKWRFEDAPRWVRERRARGLPITSGHAPLALRRWVQRASGLRWTEFVESLGIPYPGQKKRRDWTKAKVVAALRDRRRRGLPLNRSGVAADGQALTHQAQIRFGSFDAALRAAGIDPERVRLHRRWSRADVIDAIRARHAARRPVNRAAVCAEQPRLVKAAQQHFPCSWALALEAAGLDPALARAR